MEVREEGPEQPKETPPGSEELIGRRLLPGAWAAGRLVQLSMCTCRPLVPGDHPSSLDDLSRSASRSLYPKQLRTSPPTSAEGIQKISFVRDDPGAFGRSTPKKLVRSVRREGVHQTPPVASMCSISCRQRPQPLDQLLRSLRRRADPQTARRLDAHAHPTDPSTHPSSPLLAQSESLLCGPRDCSRFDGTTDEGSPLRSGLQSPWMQAVSRPSPHQPL